MTTTPAQPEQAAPRPLPLAALHEAQEAPHAPICGWRVPLHFGDPEAEYRAARETAGLMDVSFLTVVEATGKDHLEYLNRRLSQRVIELAPGTGARATQLNGEGRMEADMDVFALDGGRTLLAAPPSVGGPYLQALADKYVFTEDAQFTDATDRHAAFALFGPAAAKVLRDAGVPHPGEREIQSFAACGEDGYAFRSSFFPGAVVLLVSRVPAREFWEALCRAASAAGGRPIGFLAFDTLRVEAGTPWWGIDLNDRSIPLDADLHDAIHTNKGCYPGQETIAKILNLGHPPRKLAGLLWETEDPPPPGQKLTVDGRDAGTVTTSTFSPRLGKAVGLGMLRWNYREPGTEVVAESGAKAKVAALPLE